MLILKRSPPLYGCILLQSRRAFLSPGTVLARTSSAPSSGFVTNCCVTLRCDGGVRGHIMASAAVLAASIMTCEGAGARTVEANQPSRPPAGVADAAATATAAPLTPPAQRLQSLQSRTCASPVPAGWLLSSPVASSNDATSAWAYTLASTRPCTSMAASTLRCIAPSHCPRSSS